ncbi:hypothetical protein HLH44_09730 [Gluconacetobacter sp. 1c LMG 22058]|uniref:Permease n=1 Tax=Gluconacetobacter dulcium TaxID=2729096 RepID=A0A7W4JZR8_9PROT|nr:DUF5690 family protein [Gluconacetobacter dulcium]MBB2197731.1 hypothetical protein [Gluconacetobacter dulcium]
MKPKLASRLSRPAITAVGGIAGFTAYFSMYAFRKPVAADIFSGVAPFLDGLDYKSAVIIMQIAGYALSKLIGISVVAQFGRQGRGYAIIGLVSIAWVALILFALAPAPWNAVFFLLNGLPLGMIWGLVFSYLEGRRESDILGAVLCASFIFSSGVMKSVGEVMVQAGVSVWWMPAAVGGVFFPLLLISVWALEILPPPDRQDEAERMPRVPMFRAERMAMLRANWTMIFPLVVGYVMLTAIRDFRDNFAPELWHAAGYRDVAALFTESEAPVAIGVLVVLAALNRVRNNLAALQTMQALIILGAVMLAGATLAFRCGVISGLVWMILSGLGLYLAYTPFNAMLFDRMIAAIGKPGNSGFLIYVADAAGYCGSVAVIVLRNVCGAKENWLSFYVDFAYVTAAIVTGFGLVSLFVAHRRLGGRALVMRP